MFIFGEGRDAFNKIMSTIVTQLIFVGFAILMLYRASTLNFEVSSILFYIFTIFMCIASILWIISSYLNFNNSFQNYLYPRVKGIKFLNAKLNKDLSLIEVWKRDKKIATEYFCIQVLIIGLFVFIFFGSTITAVQIAEGINMK